MASVLGLRRSFGCLRLLITSLPRTKQLQCRKYSARSVNAEKIQMTQYTTQVMYETAELALAPGLHPGPCPGLALAARPLALVLDGGGGGWLSLSSELRLSVKFVRLSNGHQMSINSTDDDLQLRHQKLCAYARHFTVTVNRPTVGHFSS